jgi:hypothetical protein
MYKSVKILFRTFEGDQLDYWQIASCGNHEMDCVETTIDVALININVSTRYDIAEE